MTNDGVIAIDAPPTIGENMLAAIEEVTDKPVTHVIYSHRHTDDIGAASVFGSGVEIVAHAITKELLERFPDLNCPIPTLTFDKDYMLNVGGVTLELSYKGENDCPGNIFVYAPAERAPTVIDIISPGSATFMHCDASQNIMGWYQAQQQLTEFDFDFLVAGHHMSDRHTRDGEGLDRILRRRPRRRAGRGRPFLPLRRADRHPRRRGVGQGVRRDRELDQLDGELRHEVCAREAQQQRQLWSERLAGLRPRRSITPTRCWS